MTDAINRDELLRAVEFAEQIGAMFGENKEVKEENT